MGPGVVGELARLTAMKEQGQEAGSGWHAWLSECMMAAVGAWSVNGPTHTGTQG